MIVGVGIDVVDIARFGVTLDRTPALRARLFTAAEPTRPLASLAARFAAKEALAKALGRSGRPELARRRGPDRRDGPSVTRDHRHGGCARRRRSGVTRSHVRSPTMPGIASAVVVLEG